jgi:hypothetical protein
MKKRYSALTISLLLSMGLQSMQNTEQQRRLIFNSFSVDMKLLQIMNHPHIEGLLKEYIQTGSCKDRVINSHLQNYASFYKKNREKAPLKQKERYFSRKDNYSFGI